MKVNVFGSLSAKLFYLIVAMIVATGGLFTLSNVNDMQKILKAQLKDRSLNDVEIPGRAIQGILEHWEAQLGVVLQAALVNEDQKIRNEQILSFVNDRIEFVAVHIFKKQGSKTEEINFSFSMNREAEFKSADLIGIRSQILKTNQRSAKFGTKNRFVKGLAQATGLPLINLGKVFKIKGQDVEYLVLLTAWQDPLVETLVRSNIIKNIVLDRFGRVLSSRNFGEMKQRNSYRRNYLFRMASSEKSQDLGYIERFLGNDRKDWLGAYFRIPKYDLYVLVQQDHLSAFQDIRESIQRSVWIGALILLGSILFGYLGVHSVTKKLKVVTLATEHIARGQFDTRIGFRTSDEVGLLSMSVDLMASKIQSLLVDQVHQAETKRDLEMAQAVQETLFPKANRTHDVLRVSGFSIPASETGGDWWGHYSTGDGVEYVFVADAMGHGVPAALVTAVAYSSCMTLAHMLADTSQTFTPGQILHRVNQVLYEAVEGTISMTFFGLMIDYRKGEITYANAGHNFPILIPADANDDRIKKKMRTLKGISTLTPISLRASGTILGVENNVEFKDYTMVLRPGDKFFLFTDGLIECRSPAGKMWGRRTMIEKVMSLVTETPETIKDSIVKMAFDFFEDQPRDDDLTVVAVEFPLAAKVGGNWIRESEVDIGGSPRFLDGSENLAATAGVFEDNEKSYVAFGINSEDEVDEGLEAEPLGGVTGKLEFAELAAREPEDGLSGEDGATDEDGPDGKGRPKLLGAS